MPHAEAMVFTGAASVRTTDGWTDRGLNKDRSVAVSTGSVDTAPPDILDAIRHTSARHRQNPALVRVGLEPEDWNALFRALIEAESAYRPNALSPKGAYGLGQLMPETAKALGVDRRDIHQNLDGAARYLLEQIDAFRDIDLALAAYNAGPDRVAEYGGVPPFSETRSYIARIHRIRKRLADDQATHSARRFSEPRHRTAVVLGLK